MVQYIPPQIDYTSRDFEALRTELIGLVRSRVPGWSGDDPADFAVALIDAFSYMGDTMSYYIDRAANESSLANATKIQTLLDMASMFGYRPSGPTPATVGLRFTNISETTLDVPVGTQVSAPLALGPYSEVFFEVIQSATGIEPGSSVTLAAVEGKTVNTDNPGQIVNNKPLPTRIGSSDGLANQEFLINETGVVDSSIKVFVGQGSSFTGWRFVDNLIEWGPYDQVFTTKVTADAKLRVVFGDGINGAIPATGEIVSALYRTSVGVSGNIAANSKNIRATFIPGVDQDAVNSLSITNDQAATGGSDGDNIITLRAKLAKVISARRRAVTAKDYESLAAGVPNVGQAKVIATGPTNVTLRMQTNFDGSDTPGIENGVPNKQWYTTQSAVLRYLEDKVPIGTAVTVNPPVYVPVQLSLTVNAKPAYKNRDVKLEVAKSLLSSNFGLFAYGNYGFGSKIFQSDIISVVAGLDSVASVSLTLLKRSAFINGATLSSGDVVFSGYHTFKVGDTITVTGANPEAFNVTGTVSAVSSSTFTVTPDTAVSGTPTYVSGGLAASGEDVSDVQLADHEIPYLPTSTFTVLVLGGVL